MAANRIDEAWIAHCAYRLREHGPRIALDMLEDTARELWQDTELRALDGEAAARQWLQRCDRHYSAAA